jgi:hypothetical protein
MEKVLIGSRDCSAIDATTELESMPPLKNAPSGTSAILRMRTHSSNFSRSWAAASASANRAAWSVLQPPARLELADRTEGAERLGDVGKLEVEPERVGIDVERNARLP